MRAARVTAYNLHASALWFADRQHGGVVAVRLAAMTVGLALRANPRAPVAHTITLVRASARVNWENGNIGRMATWHSRYPGGSSRSAETHPSGRHGSRDWPATLRDLERRWSLTVGVPFDGDDVSCAWVAPVTLATGQSAVLKLGMPHMEGEHEIEGLRFWNGDPTVRLLDADDDLGAMLLERCEPGTALRGLPEPEQDEIIATLLRRLWRTPAEPHRFRPLSAMTAHWCRETMTQEQWPDTGLVRGLRSSTSCRRCAAHVLLATDLHAGNVLQARRSRGSSSIRNRSRRPRVRCDPASAELQREVARGCAWNHPPLRGSPRRR